ncbi:glycosyl transferase [Mitsuaria sp. CC2]|uniref:glycosyl transferase n=1 Tax=Mitsuaria sp. CC2 TaxID=3029186 RepID=UPI003B8AEAFC
MKQVICVKWGTAYGPEYVNRLYGMLRRHITGEFRLVCLTDNAEGLRPEVDAYDLPELGCEWPKKSMGKWRKLVMWSADMGEKTGLSGPVLFVDLDSVIVDNIDGYFSHGNPEDVILARNWAKPMQRLGQTSVFRFPVGKYPHIIENFRANPQGVADKHGFEQHWVTASVPGGIKFWPHLWTRHFRLHCLPPFPLRYFKPARLPAGARIVTFPGGPNPADVLLGRWNTQDPPHEKPWDHFRAAFAGGVKHRWRHLRSFVLPPPWVAQHWVE